MLKAPARRTVGLRLPPFRVTGRLVVQVLTGALVLTYLLSTVLRTPGVTIPFFDGWIGNLGYGGCAVMCAWRAYTVSRQRLAWSAIALSLALFAVGAVLWTTVVQYWNPVPYPSPSDIFFLVFYPVAYLGIGLLIRDSLPRRSSGAWFDGLIAALGVAAIESAFVISEVARKNNGNLMAVLTNFAYPIGDLVLVTMLVGLFAIHGWRPPRMWWLLGLGFAIFAGADTVYVLRVLNGTYQTGTPLDSLWLIGTYLVGCAAFLKPRATRDIVQPGRRSVFVPVFFLLTSIAIVLADGLFYHVGLVAVVLAIATLMCALTWIARSYRQLQHLATLRREATTDELTGLGNRRMLLRELDARLSSDPPTSMAVLIVDLDRFKEVNDAFGHPVGDELLTQLGPRLRRTLRREDLLARMGGDEFAIVLNGADRAYAMTVGARILDALSAPFALNALTVYTGASVGIALAPEHAHDSAELLRCADVAMYRSKTRRTLVEVYETATDTSLDRFELVDELRTAVTNGLLTLHYQPQLDLHTGQVRGLEALVRWPHPTRGFIPPDVFIPLAEETRLMRPLTRHVLDEALRQAAAWERNGTPVPVAVNLSATNVLDVQTVADVRQLLAKHAVEPARLVLEITEAVLLTDPLRARANLTALRALGVSISLDDFGTGFSSLAYLRHLPVDELKLDKVFVTSLGVTQDDRDTAIASSALTLGHALGLTVVAEGVENAETIDALDALGFDAAQGYLLGRPVPAEEIVLTDVAPDTESVRARSRSRAHGQLRSPAASPLGAGHRRSR